MTSPPVRKRRTARQHNHTHQRWKRLLFAVGLGLWATTAGCDRHDLGTACGTTVSTISTQPVDGEVPVVEVVRVERSTTCESLQCLHESGLSGYCTRQCTVHSAGAACATHADCSQPQHCFNGRCHKDSCPAGFACQQPQTVGPLASQLLCIRKQGCTDNSDCEDLGQVECRRLGCVDECIKNPDTCTFHQEVCHLRSELTFCQCREAANTGNDVCSDADYECQPVGSATKWPTGSVKQRGVCFGKDQ